MKSLLVLTALLVSAPFAAAQKADPAKWLDRALKLFPDSDADKDGKLSLAEALKYVEAHPELRELMAKKTATPRIPNGAPPLTPAAPGLPPGPRIFVCAHSFMIYTAKLLPPLATAAGIGYQDAGQQMLGGSQVIQHWNVPDEKNRAKAALREGKVDVLTVSPHMLLPDAGIDLFTQLGLEKNPKLRVLVQASWPGRDGSFDPSFSNESRNAATAESLKAMHDLYHSTWVKALEEQVGKLNVSSGRDCVRIVPVGDAVMALRQHVLNGTAPGIAKQADLFRDTLGHPQPPLAALVAYCHFAAIFQRTPVGLPVPTELKSTPEPALLNSLLQKLAWEAVTQYPLSGVSAKTAQPIPAE